MSWTKLVRAIFYLHQTSDECTGLWACDCMHQLEKTVEYVFLYHKELRELETYFRSYLATQVITQIWKASHFSAYHKYLNLLDQETSFEMWMLTCILPVLSRHSSVVVSTEGFHQIKFGLVPMKVRIIDLACSNIPSEINQPPSVCFTL